MNGRFRHPRGASPEAQAFGRQHWLNLVGELRRAGEAAALGQPRELSLETALRAGLRRGVHAPFPVDGASALEVRDALLAAGRALMLATGERQAAIAALALAASQCAEALLDEQARTAAAVWQRQFKDD